MLASAPARSLNHIRSIMGIPDSIFPEGALTATDSSGRRLVQYALPGCDFETAEALEADGLIKLEFTNDEWTTRVLAPDDIRVVVWQFNVNEQDRVHGRPLHFPDVTKRWFYFDESTVTVGSA
jgi:hypothetical protein